MMRAMSAALHWAWWRFVLMTCNPCHPAYLHAQWRLFQERETLRNFLKGEQ